MRAIVQDRYGTPDVLEVRDVPRPAPKDNEVLIRIRASVVTPPDCAMRQADPFITRFITGLVNPRALTLGDGVAGEVEAVGSRVTRWHAGDRVFGTSAPAFDAHAEYICLAETGALAATPAGLGDAEAVAITDGFLTALPFLRDVAAIRPGQALLVNGAAGSVGTAAVQLGRHFGAEVTGVCSAGKRELVASLGAYRVIDYTREDFAAAGPAYDIIFDAAGKSSFSRCKGALRSGGVYMTTVPSFGILGQMLWTARVGDRRAKFATTGLRPVGDKAKDLLLLIELATSGAMRPVIDRRYRLEQIAEAHRYVDMGHKAGSVVVEM